DPRNIAGIDLPHCPPPDVGPDGAYADAAGRLEALRHDAVLIRDGADCLYAYEQAFERSGRSHCRRTVIAVVRLRTFGEGVWPHERTFPGPKLDRMKLRHATRTQLSPIFGFYAGADAAEGLFDSLDRPPDAAGTLDGVTGRLWAVSDPARIEAVQAALADRDLFIADGHHRYITAINYRDALGDIGPDHPANYVMFVLAAASDPHLVVLPAHRLISGLKGFDLDGLLARAEGDFDFQPVELTAVDVADAGAFLRRFGRGAMALASGDRAVVARLRDPAVMDKVAADHCPAWRELDVAVLHRLLIERHLADDWADSACVRYLADGPAALSAARTAQADLVTFLQATPLSAVETVARAGEVMPPKSTYFYPKPATGMVLYPLE
ncbi:MAG: DUF1015 family protein, partial [Planctomycetota bacterium]